MKNKVEIIEKVPGFIYDSNNKYWLLIPNKKD